MAKKKTTKFKVYPQTYQFGGIPFLDQYQKLGKQWDTFWRGGNYFSPGNTPPTGVYADPNAMLYNTVGNNNAATTAYTNNKQTLKDNSYTGEWGAQAHNDYYNKTLGNQYTPSQLTAFAGFEKAGLTGNTDNTAYNNWYTGRQAYANQAGAQFDSERLKRNNALAEQPGVEKQMGDAFANTFSGVTTGLNYINSYVPPEQINLVKGSKGVMYGQHGANVNLTGYTNGTPTMNNPINEIPSGNISAEQTPIPILAIGKKGADNGLVKILQPNSKGYNFKSKSTVEIPLEQQTQEQMRPIARYGKQLPYAQSGLNIAAMLSGAAGQVPNIQNQQANYLNQLSGGEYINATPEFNQRMLAGFNQSQNLQQTQGLAQLPQVGNNILEPQSGFGFAPMKIANALQPSFMGKLAKGGTKKVADYQQMLRSKGYNVDIDGAWGPKTQAAYEALTGKKAPSKTAVNTGKAKIVSNIIKSIYPVGTSLSTYQVTSSGYPPRFQFGGSVNDQHAIPIFSSNLEDFGLTELQTEKNEIAFMPDGSIVDVKAKELHKKQDKHNVSDIMQSGTYVFSNDPKMKFGIKSKIGGVELGDMKLGKSVFKYKENEVTPGPEDIMLKDMFFNGSKKELTTADIAKNVKKNLPIVDLKNDYFADRSIAENKDQRKEYLSVLKAFNEYRKPKSRSIPNAQYGMLIQPTQNGLDGVMGYGDKQADPFKKMDNNMLSMWNIPQPKLPNIPRMYNDGGNVPQAQFGWLADGIDAIGGWSNRAKREQERKNEILRQEAQGYRDNLQSGVDRAGALGVGTNMATYAASLNVPLQRYDDQSEQMSMYNAAANRAVQRLEASKYTASQGIGGASTLARYSNPTNYGDYLAKTQSQSDTNIGKLNQAIADLDMQRANANIGFTSARNAGRNQSLNARDTQVYNANVQGIGNVGRSAQEATFNSADTRYRMGNEKMAYDAYLTDKALAAKQAKQQQIRGYTNEIGQLGLTYATGGFGGDNLFAKDKPTNGQSSYNFNVNPSSFGFQNTNQQYQQSPANGQFNNTYGNYPMYNSLVPGGATNRSTQFNIPINWGFLGG